MGKSCKKENESLICKQDILNDELRQLEKCNSEFLEDFKKFGKQRYKYLWQSEKLEKKLENLKIENFELKNNLMLVDEIKKENEDLSKKLKVLKEEK